MELTMLNSKFATVIPSLKLDNHTVKLIQGNLEISKNFPKDN